MLDAAYIASLNCLRLMNDTTAGTLPNIPVCEIFFSFGFIFSLPVQLLLNSWNLLKRQPRNRSTWFLCMSETTSVFSKM
jgi:hypothetical protein